MERPVVRARRGLSTGQIIAVVAVIAVVLIGCLVAGYIALMLPALGKARGAAQALKSSAQMKMIHQAATVRRMDGEEGAPFAIRVEDLIAAGYINADILESPFGDAPGGGPDYWTLPGEIDPDTVANPDAFVVIYDRAMYARFESVAVIYLDGTTGLLDTAEFRRRLETEPNAGRDFDLPAPR